MLLGVLKRIKNVLRIDTVFIHRIAACRILLEESIHTAFTQRVLSMNPDEKIYPASMTKIMTCLLSLEILDTSSKIEVSKDLKAQKACHDLRH